MDIYRRRALEAVKPTNRRLFIQRKSWGLILRAVAGCGLEASQNPFLESGLLSRGGGLIGFTDCAAAVHFLSTYDGIICKADTQAVILVILVILAEILEHGGHSSTYSVHQSRSTCLKGGARPENSSPRAYDLM